MEKYIVIKSEELSDVYEPRYVVVDTETGEIVDNAQGYGYRTREKAFKAWGYKQNLKKNQARDKQLKSEVKCFIKKHKGIFNQLDDMLFEAAKCGEDVKNKEIAEFLKSQNIELPWPVKTLMKYM